MINKLNLLWRIIGGNIILVLISIILLKLNKESANFLLTTNLMTIIIVSLQLMIRKKSMLSETSDILTIYVICATVVNWCNIQNGYHCLIATLCSIINSTWIVRFFMVRKVSKAE